MNSASPPILTRGHFIAGVVHRALAGDPELTLSGLMALLGWPEETGRSYREGDTSPSYDRCVHACRRTTTPPTVVLDLAQTLAGPRGIVCLVDNQGVPAGTRPADVVKEMIEALCGFQVLLQETYERAGDGVICGDDAAAIAKGWAEVRGLGERAVRYGQHCAAQAARR